jgi:hypothetical protein
VRGPFRLSPIIGKPAPPVNSRHLLPSPENRRIAPLKFRILSFLRPAKLHICQISPVSASSQFGTSIAPSFHVRTRAPQDWRPDLANGFLRETRRTHRGAPPADLGFRQKLSASSRSHSYGRPVTGRCTSESHLPGREDGSSAFLPSSRLLPRPFRRSIKEFEGSCRPIDPITAGQIQARLDTKRVKSGSTRGPQLSRRPANEEFPLSLLNFSCLMPVENA